MRLDEAGEETAHQSREAAAGRVHDESCMEPRFSTGGRRRHGFELYSPTDSIQGDAAKAIMSAPMVMVIPDARASQRSLARPDMPNFDMQSLLNAGSTMRNSSKLAVLRIARR